MHDLDLYSRSLHTNFEVRTLRHVEYISDSYQEKYSQTLMRWVSLRACRISARAAQYSGPIEETLLRV